MLTAAIRNFVERRLNAVCRQVVLRGYASRGHYSCEDRQNDPGEPEASLSAKRAGRYGFVSECPPGALVATIRIGQGVYVGVAETVPGEPEIDEGEVLIWTKYGQRLLLNEDGDVVVTPKAGRKVLLGAAADGDCDPVVTKSELNTVLAKIRAHTHPSVSALAGDFSALDPVGLSVSGSPVVEAAKP